MARIHHVALGARDVDSVARFYRDVLRLPEVARKQTEDGTLRAIWLDAGGPILMIERTERPAQPVEAVGSGFFLLALAVSREERARFELALEAAGSPIESRTEYTSYARDPEGNRVAISHYPVA